MLRKDGFFSNSYSPKTAVLARRVLAYVLAYAISVATLPLGPVVAGRMIPPRPIASGPTTSGPISASPATVSPIAAPRSVGAVASLGAAPKALRQNRPQVVRSAPPAVNGIAASVGYADSTSASPNFPTPWQGSPNTVFIGSGGSGNSYNAGAIRLDNTTSSAINVDSVTVNLQRPGPSFSLWGSFTIPAGSSVILTQTAASNFVTSGSPIVSCGGSIPAGNTQIPQITVSVGGNPSVFLDTSHVLDTGGFDLGCRGNRSLAWRPVGTTGIESPSASVTLTPDGTITETGVSVQLTAQIADAAALPLANAGVSFSVTSGPNTGKTAQATSDSNGNAPFSYTSAQVGSDAVKASLANLTGASVTSTVTANWSGAGACTPSQTPADSLVYVGQTSVSVDDQIRAAALLTDVNGNGLSGQAISFTLLGRTLSATTDANGQAQTTFAAIGAGSASVTASFAGTAAYPAVSASATIMISKENTILRYTGSTMLGTSVASTVTALLQDAHGMPLANESVTFAVGSVQASANTNTSGVATASLTLASSAAQAGAQMQVSFAGDANYNASSAASPIDVYLSSQFVVWGGNSGGLHLGQDVNFWGSQWASQVTGGAYNANPSFKGFAENEIGPPTVCEPTASGSTLDDSCWSSKGGNSFPPDSLPAYIGVIISNAINKSGSETYGNIAALAVLKVDSSPAYSSDPGHPGFGTIVAIIADGAHIFPTPVQLTATQSQPATVLPGQSYVVSVTLNNAGQTAATSIAINESFDGTTPATGTQNVASLGSGSPFTATFNETAPTYLARQSNESSAQYEARLGSVDGRLFTSTGSITYTDASNQPYLPISLTSFSHLQLPRLTVSLSASTCVSPGGTWALTATVTNVGSATASGISAIVTLPDGSTRTLAVNSLNAGMSFVGTINAPVPGIAPIGANESTSAYLARLANADGTSLTASITANWQDAQGNSYGAVNQQFSGLKENVPIVSGTLTVPSTMTPGDTATVSFATTNTGKGNAIETDVTIVNPDNSKKVITPFSLTTRQSNAVTSTWIAPFTGAKQSNESDSAYQARLSGLDGASLAFNAVLGWKDSAGTLYGPTNNPGTSTRTMPVLSISLVGPPSAISGNTIAYTATVQNIGHGAAASPTLSVVLPDGSTATPALSPAGTIAPGGSASATISFTIPSSTATGQLLATASLSWKDIHNNVYGPLSSTAAVQTTRQVPSITVTLTGPSTAKPGSTLPLTATLTNAGNGAASGISAVVTLPDGTTNPLSVTTLAAGANFSATINHTVPAITPIGSTESTASYLARLSAANTATLAASINATWLDAANTSYGPVNQSFSAQERVAILNVTPTVQSTLRPGDTATVNVSMQNTGGADATGTTTVVTNPDNTTASANSVAVPAGQTVSASTTWVSPNTVAKQSGETDAAYITRLSALDKAVLSFSTSVAWTDGTGNYGPETATITSTRSLPILSVNLTGPSTVSPGTTLALNATITNNGSGAASGISAIVTLPDGTTSTLTVPALAAGQNYSTTVNFTVPALTAKGASETTAQYLARLAAAIKTLNSSLPVTWQDAHGNSYGPLTSSSSTQQVVPVVAATPTVQSTLLPGSTANISATMQNTGNTTATAGSFQVTNPDNSSASATFTVAAQQSTQASTTWAVPSTVAKQPSETDAAYQLRLAGLDYQTLSFNTATSWKDTATNAYGPTSAAVTSTRVLPILAISLTGPATANSGDAISYTATIQNVGHAAAATPTLSVLLPDGTTSTPTLPASIAAGGIAPISIPFTIPPATATGQITATATLAWKDANANNYGPQSSSAAVMTTRLIPALTVSLTGPTTALPGSTLALTATLTNTGNGAASGVLAVVTLPDGTMSTLPLTTLAAGANFSTVVNWTVPALAPIGAAETVAQYVTRISMANNAALAASLKATWLDAANTSYGPANATFSAQERVAILSGAPTVQSVLLPGDTATVNLGVQNSGSADATAANVKVTNPDTFSNVGPFVVAAGQTTAVSATWVTPNNVAKQSGESDAAYQTRLTSLDRATLTFTSSLTWTDGVGSYGPENSTVTATRSLPVLSVSLTGPSSVNPGGVLALTATIVNNGSGAASNITASITLPDGTTTTLTVPALASTQSYSTTVNWNVPAIAAKGASETTTQYLVRLAAANKTWTASLQATWQDARGNNYGPLTPSLSAQQSVPAVAGTPTVQSTLLPGSTANISATLQNNGGATATGSLQVTNPDNSQSSASFTLTASQSLPFSTTWPVPSTVAKLSGESDPAYLTRLTGLDNQALSFATAISWKDAANNAYGPDSATITSTRVLPVLGVTLAAPANAVAGTAITYTITVTNSGHAAGTPALTVVMPDGTSQTPALSPIPAGGLGTATVVFNIPSTVSGAETASASVMWSDTNNNSYGPLSATASTTVAPALTLTVSAGQGQSVLTPQDLTLQGVVTVTPSTAVSTVVWSQVSGPGMVTFANPQSTGTVAHIPSPGTYDLRLTATAVYGGLKQTQSSDITITATAGTSTPPTVSAGPDQTITLPTSQVTLNGAVSDSNGSFTVAWTQLSGPAAVTFTPANTAVTVAKFSVAGTYLLQLTVRDSQFTDSSTARVVVNPAPTVNQAPVVNAGANQTIALPSNVNTLPLSPTLIQLSNGTNAATGLDYHPPTGKVLMSVNYPTGKPFNFALLASDGSISQFSTISNLTDEVYLTVARDDGGGKSLGGFPAGTFFTGNGKPGQVTRVTPDGSNIQSPWVTLPNETGLLRGQLYIDKTGVWGGDLIVMTDGNPTTNVWRISADNSTFPLPGTATKLASVNMGGTAEGLVTVPNDTFRYGPWAGKILVGGENASGFVYTIDKNGTVVQYKIGINAEHMNVIGTGENYFAAGTNTGGTQTLFAIPAAELVSFTGDIIMQEEFGNGNVWDVRWNPQTQVFDTLLLGASNQNLEGMAMAPSGIGSVAATNATVTLNGTVTDDGLPTGGALTSLWTQVSGPGTASFANPNSPVTTVTLSTPGVYVLQLTASDTQLTSSSTTTVTIQANAAPVVSPGTEQQVTEPNSATLPGIVTDDGLPVGGHLSSFWTVLSGPSRVTFGAPSYDSGLDFSPKSNPNGAWSYGWEPTRGGTFTLYPSQANAPNPYSTYQKNGNSAPQLWANAGDLTSNNPNDTQQTLPPHTLGLLPSSIGENSVLRWTAPNAGTFLVQGKFFPDAIGPTTDVAVILYSGTSATTLATGTVTAGVRVPFSFVRTLNAGDYFEFSVGYGSNNNNNQDSTALQVNITQSGNPMTTAAFATTGDYLLRLVGYDGELFSFGEVHAHSVGVCTAPGMAGWWPADGTTTDTIHGDNGIAEGALTYTTGKQGQAFSLNGTNADVKVPASSNLNVSSFTIDAWINPTTVSNSAPVAEYNNNGTLGPHFWISAANNPFNLLFNYPGALYANIVDTAGHNHVFATNNGGGCCSPLAVPIVQGVWQHVALTFDQPSGNAVMYINGVVVDQANFGSITPNTANLPLYFGNRPGGARFNGGIDEVHVFNRALTPTEIAAIAGQTGLCSTNLEQVTVSAGQNQTITLPANSVNLTGTATDPSGGTPQVSWSQLSGPTIATISSPTSTATAVALGVAPGTYIFRLQASNATSTAVSDMTVTVKPVGVLPQTIEPPVVNAGPGQSIQLPTNSVTLSGTVSDPGAGTLTLLWNQVSGPMGGTTVFSTPSQATTQATFSVAGVYVLQLTAANSQNSGNATTTVVVNPQPLQPPVVLPINGQNIKLPTNTVMVTASATDPVGQTLSYAWSQVSGPAAAVFSNPTALTTQITFSNTVTGAYTFMFAASNTQFTTTATFQVTVVPSNTPTQSPVVNAGANQSVQWPAQAVLAGSAVDPAGAPLTISWTELSGPGAVTFTAPSQAVSKVSFPNPGTFTLQLSATNGQFSANSSTTVTVTAPPPPVVSAGPNQTLQIPTVAANLNGSASDPVGLPLTIQWSQLSGPAGVVFGSPTKAQSTATFPGGGTYSLQLSANDGATTVTSTVTITVVDTPVVSAGSTQSIQLPTATTTLHGTASDPGNAALTFAWTQTSGPATASIATPTQLSTSVSGLSTAGTYVFTLTASNAQTSSSASVQVIVVPSAATNQAPVVNADGGQTISLPNTTITLNGSVTDDGLPIGGTLTISWTQVSGPGAATFANPHSAVTQVTLSSVGTYTLQLSANDGALTTSKTTTITLNAAATQPPSVTVPPPQTIQLPNTTAVLNGSAVSVPSGRNLTIAWSKVSGPGTVTFANPSQAATTATFSAAGTYSVQLLAQDGSLQTTGTTSVLVLPLPGPPPTVTLSLVDGSEITQPTPITATISDGAWSLRYALLDTTRPTQNYVTMATGVGAVSNATLATFDPTLLLNGTYQIQLTSTDSVGQVTTATSSVTVSRNMKIGVFSLAFNDMTVPLTGLPITITRSYDSRDKNVGDFGVGWRLAVTNIRLQKNHSLSANWFEDLEYSALSPQFCISSTNTKIVTVVFPNNTVYKFQAQASPQCQQFLSITNPTVTFQQIQATAGTQGATLAPLDGGSTLIDGSPPAAINLIGLDGNLYDPTTFVLTLANGLSYTIDQVLGVRSIRDTNGNTLTFSANGIASSTGAGVTFVRDSQGRITQITDPNGKSNTYAYTGADLTSYTDRTSNTTTFAYAPGDYLTGVTLPNGQSGLTAGYDPTTNRLTSTTDALGKSIGMTYNLAANTQTVTDRNGNATTYVYDQDGNILQTTDALGHVTSSTYDASDNKTSDTDALNRTTNYTYDAAGNLRFQTDPLGNVTGYTYNALNKPLTITDPRGNVTTNTYDTHGNLLTTKDAAGNVTTNTYDNFGRVTSTTDANSKTTSFAYDNNGNLLMQTDALTNVTTNTYDGNGNRLTQSVMRTFNGAPQTLLTQYAYDGQNRLTKTTFPDNTFTQTHYNTLGQVDVRTDELGHQTQYVYDSDGRLTTTTYADNTTDVTQYDANGNRMQTTNRGIVTAFGYDAINRLTSTTAAPTTPNAATTTTNYDAAGQVTSTVDALGNTTTYFYDNAGRRTKVQNALSQTTVFGYDAAGNQLTVKDANNNVTTSTYDADNRLVKTTYPDGKFDSTAYDAVGRVRSRTDANGNVTQYGYDPLGRLTSVTDALNQITSYGYDEVGNRISQTDANLHTTNYQYDQRGRRIGRTLPGNQSESYAYDNAGNLHSRTDFNGKTTTYGYDTLNRLLSKTPDASFSASPVTFTYTNTGKRQTMADPSGTTTYGYDNRDRLTSKNTPEGTLNYTYDLASNLTVLSTAGLTVNYTYDVLNRLATVAEPNTGTTSYSYDAVGNLASFATPNGISHGYTYDARNRLTNLAVGTAAANVASYAYTLDAAGHRTSVTELSGRTVNYAYDNIYRLTNESVVNVGTVSYTYDAVGNRKTLSSTLAPIQSTTSNFDSDDRLSTDGYDSNGNTTQSSGAMHHYDFENHLLSTGAVSIVYDGDGNRVSKTVNGVTTKYLVADWNPTGYAQVILETTPSETRQFVYGLERLSQRRNGTVTYYGYDGHGSVRLLTDSTGTVTDMYDYDAFGNIVNSSGVTPNEFLFAGEQFDSDLQLYYNRARYLNTTTGRFLTGDSQEPTLRDPSSLHRYLYSGANPVDFADPTGLYTQQFGYAVEDAVQAAYIADFGDDPLSVSFGKWSRQSWAYTLKPDILDLRVKRGDGSGGRIWMEIKPLTVSGIARASYTWGLYGLSLGFSGITPDTKWLRDGRVIPVASGGTTYSTLVFNVEGILFYTTNKSDLETFHDILEETFGFTLSVAVGTAAGKLVNFLTLFGKQASEIETIKDAIPIAIKGTEAENSLDLVA